MGWRLVLCSRGQSRSGLTEVHSFSALALIVQGKFRPIHAALCRELGACCPTAPPFPGVSSSVQNRCSLLAGQNSSQGKGKRRKERPHPFPLRVHLKPALIHSLHTYLLSIFHMPETALDAGDSAVNKPKPLPGWSLHPTGDSNKTKYIVYAG